ncbi:MAG: SRPBCC domain-containing protein [Planctomycetota bacterium]
MGSKVELREDGLTITRVFDAGIERVFQAWTDPDKVSAWWGCAQTKKVTSFIDLRVGGEYRYVMEMEGGMEFDAKGIISELNIPKRFVYEVPGFEMEGMPPMPAQKIEVDFKAIGDKTEVKLTHSGIVMAQIKGEVKKGWSAAFEKLNDRLARSGESR